MKLKLPSRELHDAAKGRTIFGGTKEKKGTAHDTARAQTRATSEGEKVNEGGEVRRGKGYYKCSAISENVRTQRATFLLNAYVPGL